MASLVTAEGTSFELAEAETLVGRGGREYNDPPKVDVGPLRGGPTVSRHHARIFRRGGQWYLRVEPEARNPTIVAGRRVPGGEEVPLADDTRIQVGDVVLTFKSPEQAPRRPVDQTMAEPDGHDAAPPPPPAPEPLAAEPVRPAPKVAAAEPAPQPAPAEAAPSRPAPQPAPAQPSQPAPVAAWPARLAGRPAAIGALGLAELKRVNPFRGLMIDEEAWADAHDYHRYQDRLHVLASHGWGVVEGLEVVADPQAPDTLVVRPGIAFDPQGRALLVAQERRLPVSAAPGTALYLILRLREELAAPQRFWNDLDEYTRVVERSEILVQSGPPAPPALELARLTVQPPLRNAPDPASPQPGEVDLRFRERLALRPRPELAVAQVIPAEGDGAAPSTVHRLGLRYLLREIGLTTPYRPRWAGVFRLGEPLPPVSVVYLTGAGRLAIGDDAAGRLRELLLGGGVVLADACGEAQGKEFAAGIQSLAGALGCGLEPVARWHPVLTSRHVLAEPPLTGKDGGTLVEGGGLVLSTVDLGCAWQGGPREKPLSRESIRAALELGVNVAVFARQRQRPLEVVELEA